MTTTTITAAARKVAEQMDAKITAGELIITRGGRTGKKVHTARPGSSCLSCGRWTKANASYWQIHTTVVELLESGRTDNLCQKCFAELLEALNN